LTRISIKANKPLFNKHTKTPPITLAASNHFNKSLHTFIDLYAVILSDGRGYLTYTAYKLEAIIKRYAIIDPNVTGTFEDGI